MGGLLTALLVLLPFVVIFVLGVNGLFELVLFTLLTHVIYSILMGLAYLFFRNSYQLVKEVVYENFLVQATPRDDAGRVLVDDIQVENHSINELTDYGYFESAEGASLADTVSQVTEV